jgi:lysozyme family protein
MQHPLSILAPEYTSLLGSVSVLPARQKECEDRAQVIISRAKTHDWASVTTATGVPLLWGGPSFERESASDYTRSPAQGDPWNRVSTHVPRGLGPYKAWAASAIPAYRIDGLDKVGAGKWNWPTACYYWEKFNGFGYRDHGIRSSYLWGGTNLQQKGGYPADGQWDPNHEDKQLGTVTLALAMIKIDPSLAFEPEVTTPKPAAPGVPAKPEAPPAIPPITPTPIGNGSPPGTSDEHDTTWLQERLNALGAYPPLDIDGSYGRETERAVRMFQIRHGLTVDGLFGPETLAAMETSISQAVATLTGSSLPPPTEAALMQKIEALGIVPGSEADAALKTLVTRILGV